MPLNQITDCVKGVLVTIVTSFSLRKQLNQVNANAIERRCIRILRGPLRDLLRYFRLDTYITVLLFWRSVISSKFKACNAFR
jgi:hypothetical protein